MHMLEELTPNSSQANDLLLFASRELQTDKIYYVLECYLNTEDQEEKFALQADLAGDFIPNAALKKIYRRIFGKPAKMMKAPFSKTKNTQDYFAIFAFSASYDEDVLEGRHELENLESIPGCGPLCHHDDSAGAAAAAADKGGDPSGSGPY